MLEMVYVTSKYANICYICNIDKSRKFGDKPEQFDFELLCSLFRFMMHIVEINVFLNMYFLTYIFDQIKRKIYIHAMQINRFLNIFRCTF